MKIYSDFPFKKSGEPIHIAKVVLHVDEPVEEKIIWSRPLEEYGSAYNDSTIATALATLAELAIPDAALEIEALGYQAPFNQELMNQVLRQAILEAAESV